MPVSVKERIYGAYRKLNPQGRTLLEFFEGKGQTDFIKEVRKSYRTQHLNIDFSIDTLIKSQNYTRLEAELLNKAFHNVKRRFESEKGVTIIGDSILITSTLPNIKEFKGKKIFEIGTPLFRIVAKEAADLVPKEYANKTLSDRELQQLSLKVANNEPITMEESYWLAFSRQAGIAEGKTGRLFKTAAGHIEGHENYRLVAATRAGLLIGAIGKENVPKQFLEEIRTEIDIDEETFTNIINIQAGKVSGRSVDSFKFTQKVVMEMLFVNSIRGAKAEKEAVKDLAKRLDNTFRKYSDNRKIQELVTGSEWSPSFISRIENSILAAITGKSKYTKEFSKQKKTKRKGGNFKDSFYTSTGLASKIAPRFRKKITASSYRTVTEGFKVDAEQIDLFSVRNLINEVLAIKVEEQMGDSTDAPIKLRYQTGRFADSAKLLTLTREQAGTLFGTYTYQRNPYDVFLPGGRLGTAQRDPRIYVESAIQEAAMSILRRKFPGLQLELQ